MSLAPNSRAFFLCDRRLYLEGLSLWKACALPIKYGLFTLKLVFKFEPHCLLSISNEGAVSTSFYGSKLLDYRRRKRKRKWSKLG